MKKENGKYVFEKSVYLKTNVKSLFQFHLDTNNLSLISPPFPKPSLKYMSDNPLKENSTVIVKLSFFLLTTDWKIRIAKVVPYKLIGDLQEKGLFEYWYHSHIFEQDNDFVRMTDKVEFIPPFGFFGKLFLPLILPQLKIMFGYRHKKTKDLFER